MFKIILTVVFIAGTTLCFTQPQTNAKQLTKNNTISISPDDATLKKYIIAQATEMLSALKNHNYIAFTTFQHPDVIKALGGDTNFTAFIKQQMSNLKNTKIVVMKPGQVRQIIRVGNAWQCVVDQLAEMHLDSSSIISTVVPLIGFSNDGTTWKFIDASNGVQKVKTVVTSISSELKIPYKKNQFGVDVTTLYKTYQPEFPEENAGTEAIQTKPATKSK